MATLRKNDIAARVAAKLGQGQKQGADSVNAVTAVIQEAIANGDRVVLTGHGTYELREVKERKVRPIKGGKAGELTVVPAHKRVGFTPGTELKKAAQS